jgi:hypothetical protein
MMLLGPLVVQQQAAMPLLSRNTALEAISPTAPYLLWSVVAILSTSPSLVLAIISDKAPAPASGTATSAGIPKGQLSGLISRYKTDTEDGAFASFLSEFEGLLK